MCCQTNWYGTCMFSVHDNKVWVNRVLSFYRWKRAREGSVGGDEVPHPGEDAGGEWGCIGLSHCWYCTLMCVYKVHVLV